MIKYLIIIFIIICLLAIIYYTFIVAAIEFIVGLILLGIALIAMLAAWFLWKKKNKES